MITAGRAVALSFPILLSVASMAWGQSARSPDASKPTPVGEYVSLVGGVGEVPWVVVDYPWAKLTDVSLEIRLVSGRAEESAGRAGPGQIQPMRFRANWMHGKRLAELVRRMNWLRQRRLRRIPVAAGIEEPEVVTWPNQLGRTAVAAIEHFGRDATVAGGEAIPGVAIALPWLRQWSLGDDRLVIDLPPAEFGAPGWLRVWLLRGEVPVWRQDLPWPGGKGDERQ